MIAHVVGYGMIDGLGAHPDECFAHFLDNNDYVSDLDFFVNGKITKGIKADQTRVVVPQGYNEKQITRTQRLAIHATHQALEHANLPRSINVAVIISTVANDSENIEDSHHLFVENRRVHPLKVVNRLPDIACNQVASYYDFRGASYSLFASCSTGLISIDCAMKMLDEYDYVVVGAADAGCFSFGMKYFAYIQALANHTTPFDDRRAGFVMGEGAGTLILQNAKKVAEFGSTIHATLHKVGMASDAYDATSPHQDGRGGRMAIEKAMRGVEEIHAINAHATSTPLGDIVEYNVLADIFPNVPIYAPKAKIGHTLGASGILETIYAILAMKHGKIPHIHNFQSSSFLKPEGNLNLAVRDFPQVKTLRTLKNSFGFGGKCASMVIEVTR
ncbi:MAG: beta-ketoacyl synthase N-terminal-like domain-containing protein [Deinococcales bacterium]